MSLAEIYKKKCLVFGVGNPLFGDDGFGPEVIQALESQYAVPNDVTTLDVGTSIRDILFDILLVAERPEKIIIVDAMEKHGYTNGEIAEIDVDDINPEKMADFSLHQFPTTNMLKEIKEGTDIDVRVLVVQTEGIPEQVCPGMSPPVAAAVPRMCAKIMSLVQAEGAGMESSMPMEVTQ